MSAVILTALTAQFTPHGAAKLLNKNETSKLYWKNLLCCAIYE
jgi:hypothetical protein